MYDPTIQAIDGPKRSETDEDTIHEPMPYEEKSQYKPAFAEGSILFFYINFL